MNDLTEKYLKPFLLAASVALAVPLSVAAFPGGRAECGGPGHHAPGPDHLPPHLAGLDLSEAQRDKVFDILHAQAPQMRDKVKALDKAEEALRTLTNAADYSEAKARAQADVVARAVADLSLLRSQTDRRVLEVLTPEQRQQVAERKLAPGVPPHHHRGPAGELPPAG